MILLLSRGSFCPKDHQQHLELAANYPKIAVVYTQIVTISTDNILETNEFRDQVGAQWTFLSDAGRHVQKDLDIQEYTDPHPRPDAPVHAGSQARAGHPQHLTATGSGSALVPGPAPRPARGDPRPGSRERTTAARETGPGTTILRRP